MLTVIIPTLNERQNIERLLVELSQQQDIELEIVVADGGSTDGTVELTSAGEATLVKSKPGRGCQMNAGARASKGDLLLFLHADSSLTDPVQLSRSVAHLNQFEGNSNGAQVAAHFSLRFDTDNPELSQSLRYFEEKTLLNRPGCWNGDQGLLISRKLFQLLGGFSEKLGFLEDQEFGRRFHAEGVFITLPFELITSARRFEQEGFGERVMLNTLIMAMFEIGSDEFFDAAPAIYRANTESERLNVLPFFSLASRVMFSGGFLRGMANCYRVGRYATKNLWQLFLWQGIRSGNPGKALDQHDRYARPFLDNVVGYLTATLNVVIWFHLTKLFLILRRHK